MATQSGSGHHTMSGKVIPFPRKRERRHHARAFCFLKAKTPGEASKPLDFKACVTKRNLAGAIPRVRQFTTADAPTPVRSAVLDGPPSASITSSTELSMPDTTSRAVKLSSLHRLAVETAALVMSNVVMPESLKSLAKRLEVTRLALGLRPVDVCKRIDIKENRWSQYESGERQITLPVAISLCDEFGLTLDWIYRANPSGLAHELRLKIRQAA